MTLIQLKMDSKIGKLYLVASGKGLKGVFWDKQDLPFSNKGPELEILHQAQKQIREYLEATRKKFSIPLDIEGSSFQKKVWARLTQIPYGETRSYKDIANELNDKNASRAVGAANGKNPLCIIVPCHRVISSDGSLGGYSGGLDRKTKLLNLERGQS